MFCFKYYLVVVALINQLLINVINIIINEYAMKELRLK